MADKSEPTDEPVIEVADAPAAEVVTAAEAEVAEEPVEMAAEAPEPAPTEVGDEVAFLTPEGTRERVKVWLSEARYFISTLEHEVGGDAGEIIAYLKARL